MFSLLTYFVFCQLAGELVQLDHPISIGRLGKGMSIRANENERHPRELDFGLEAPGSSHDSGEGIG